MKRRKCPHRGSANMKANYKVKEVVGGILTTIIKKGFEGFKGWELHPTKGWRKSRNFIPG